MGDAFNSIGGTIINNKHNENFKRDELVLALFYLSFYCFHLFFKREV